MLSVMDKVKKLAEWFKRTRIARALGRYSAVNGGLLAGGVAFSALFSIFAALVIGFTVFMAVLGNNTDLRDAVIEQVDQALPGIIDTGGGGILSPEDLELGTVGGIAGAISVVVLLNTAMSTIANLRSAIRAIFGVTAPKENPVLGKLRDLAGFIALALAVLLTAALGIAAGALADVLIEAIGLTDATATAILLRGATLLVALAVDFGVFIFLFRVVAGIRPPRKDLLIGSLVGAIGAGVLRYLGTTAVSSVEDPLLASYAAIITLMLWINLLVRITLIVGAWTANPPVRPDITTEHLTHFDEEPNYVTVTAPHTLTWDYDPGTGQLRAGDPEPEGEHWGGLIGKVRDAHRRRRDRNADPGDKAAKNRARKDPTDPDAWGEDTEKISEEDIETT